MKTPRILAAAVALLLVLSCFSDRGEVLAPDTNPCSVPGSAIGKDNAVVLIRRFTFLPDTVRIQRGMSVTWVNCEAPTIDAHTSTSVTDAWDSGPVAPGTTYTETFDAAGSFSYFCRPHPTMRGVVIVN